MPDAITLDSDAFHTLLTDALRAGPGSPEWHNAVLKLRAAGQNQQVGELKLLMDARESLESGREYRSVRPGPGFTRKVFDEIEKENAGGKRGPTTGSTIMYLAGFIGIALVILLLYVLFQGKGETSRGIDELAGTLFTHPLVQSRFNEKKLSDDWQTFGDGAAPTYGGLVFKPTTPTDARGGVVLANPLAADVAYAINVDLRPFNSNSSEITTVFLRDTPLAGAGDADHELVFLVRDGVPQILLPDGTNVYRGTVHHNQTIALSIKLGKDVVIIEADHVRLYAGPHQLNPGQSRYLGIRFQTPGDAKPDASVVQDVLVQKQ